MKSKVVKVSLMGMVLVAMLTLAIGCVAPATAEEKTPTTITITDGFGREVTITKPVEKVAIGHFVVSEMMKLLGAENRIVAVDLRTTTDTLLYPGISQLPVIQSADIHYEGINYEKIFELRPDIFVTAAFAGQGFRGYCGQA